MKLITEGKGRWTVYGPQGAKVKIRQYKDSEPLTRREKTCFKLARNGETVSEGHRSAQDALETAVSILKGDME